MYSGCYRRDAAGKKICQPDGDQSSWHISNFSNYIGLTPTGDVLTEEGERNPAADSDEETYPEYRYQGVRARFYGLEASGTVRLWGGTSGLFVARAADSGTLDLLWRGDIVRATNRDTGEPLPRISPARVGASLAWHQGPWSAGAGFDAWAAQNRVPDDGTRATGGYTLWNASLAYRTRVQWGNSSSHLLWYLRLDNITNRLAYSATSILTSTAYPKAPLPGRSVKIGLQVTF